MKNKISTICLLLVLSVSIFANGDDGTTHSGGKSCPSGQTCLSIETPSDQTAKDDYFFKDVILFLQSVFG